MNRLNHRTRAVVLAAAGLFLGIGANSYAAFEEFSVSSGDRSAYVKFDDKGSGILEVTLKNTYSGGVADPSHVLTALFFSGAGSLTPSSAIISGTFWQNGVTITYPSGNNVGGEWRYQGPGVTPPPFKDPPGVPNGAEAGISAVGFGLFDPTSPNFGGPNLEDPSAIDGLNFGILSAGYTGGGNTGVKGTPLVKDSIIFTFTGFSGNVNDINKVSFQYGTQLTEPNLVPEPTTMIAGALLLLPFGMSTVRFIRKRRTA